MDTLNIASSDLSAANHSHIGPATIAAIVISSLFFLLAVLTYIYFKHWRKTIHPIRRKKVSFKPDVEIRDHDSPALEGQILQHHQYELLPTLEDEGHGHFDISAPIANSAGRYVERPTMSSRQQGGYSDPPTTALPIPEIKLYHEP
ncbi:hypothetical protein MMC12_005453 [Toensbergia leucococca]|nr:hypothetical protein [Toensbergia leucococca]